MCMLLRGQTQLLKIDPVGIFVTVSLDYAWILIDTTLSSIIFSLGICRTLLAPASHEELDTSFGLFFIFLIQSSLVLFASGSDSSVV